VGTGTGITLIAIGAILRFAVVAGSRHGLNLHVVGVVLMLAGVLGLVLSLLVWGPLNLGRRGDRRRGYDDEGPSARDGKRRVYQDQRRMGTAGGR
jgi:Domain of unknown function (DUF6458)